MFIQAHISDDTELRVASVFRRAANLVAPGHWVTVTSARERGPFRLLHTHQDLRDLFHIDACWHWCKGCLSCNGHRLCGELSSGPRLDDICCVPKAENIARLSALIPATDDALDKEVLLRFEAFATANGLDGLDRIVGFGRGLSPDGDDLLYGYWASAWVLRQKDRLLRLSGIDDRVLLRTTDPSNASLSYARLGLFGREMWALFEALDEGSGLDSIVSDWLGYGHSSGRMILYGVLKGLA